MSTLTTIAIKPCCAWFTVNHLCNLECRWCYGQGQSISSSSNMDMKTARNLLAVSQSIGIGHITIIGGEPTLWPHLVEFNHLCAQSKIKTTIVTNAIRFSDDEFWGRYVSCSNDTVSVSLNCCRVLPPRVSMRQWSRDFSGRLNNSAWGRVRYIIESAQNTS